MIEERPDANWTLAELTHAAGVTARALQRGLVTEDRTLLYGRYFADKYWGYVRAAVKDDALHLIDFAFREAQADTLIYLLRWSAETARERGCARIETRRDMRRFAAIEKRP